jgi:WD40 repeat protein/DNA-binding SARP family transcriptional activator
MQISCIIVIGQPASSFTFNPEYIEINRCPSSRLASFGEALMDERLEIHTLGGFRLTRAGIDLTGLGSRKAEALLVYLACTGRPQAREVLADLLWDERTQSQALGNLRRELTTLRQNLGEYLAITRQTVEMNPDSSIWLDVADLEEILRTAHERGGVRRMYQALMGLYLGDFLEGFYVHDCRGFEDWMVRERQRLHRLVVDGLHDLVTIELECGEFKSGIAHATRLLELDPLMESAHRQMMNLLAVSGQRTAALAQYKACRGLLEEELGAEPSPATQETYELLLRGERPPGIPAVPAAREMEYRRVGECPYRGLAAFREQDAAFFYGRDEFTRVLYDTIQKQPLVANVVGSSGSGKSSAVYAGLLPELRKDGNWLVADFRPGGEPLRAVAAALLPLLEPDLKETDRLIQARKLEDALSEGELSLCDVVGRVIEREHGEKRLLLVVDQFEELYTLCPEAEQRRHFMDELLIAVEKASQRRDGCFVSLLTLRADFMGQALAYRPFADVLQNGSLLMGPMNREEMRLAIEKPAEMHGVGFESGLVERILDDVGEEPGNLPLLEFALSLLWERENYGWQTHAAYEEIGRVEGALASYADQVYAGLEEGEWERARRIFMQLVRPGKGTEDTRRVATRDELGEGNWELVQHLADRRLVVTGRDDAGIETAEVVHEALIQRWGRFREWMEADRDFRSWQERLRSNLRQWEESRRDEGVLLRGAPLATAEEWLTKRVGDLGPFEIEYIHTSQALQERRLAEREGRRRRTILALSVGLVLALALAIVATLAFGQARLAENQTFSRELAAQAINNLEIDPERSVLLALEALETSETLQAVNALHASVPRLHLLHSLPYSGGGFPIPLDVSPDGALVIAGGAFSNIDIWDALSGKHLHTIENAHPVTQDLAISPIGELFVTAGFDKTAKLWLLSPDYTQPPQGPITLPEREDDVIAVTISPDGMTLASGGNDGLIYLWDIPALLSEGPEKIKPTHVIFAHQITKASDWPYYYGIKDLKFHPAGKYLVSGGADGFIRFWDPVSGRLLGEFELAGGQGVFGISLSSDGKYMATNKFLGESVDVWDLANAPSQLNLIYSAGTAGKDPIQVAFSPDGESLAVGGEDGVTELFEASSGAQKVSLPGGIGMVRRIRFSPDGSRLYTTSQEDGTVKIWDTGPDHELYGFNGDAPAFSPDGVFLAAGNPDGSIKVMGTESMKLAFILSGHQEPIIKLDFSPDGKRLASTSKDQSIRIWDLETQKEILHIPPLGVEYLTYALDFSPDGKRLAVGVGGQAIIFDTTSGKQLFNVSHPPEEGSDKLSPIRSVSFSPDGQILATTSWDLSNKLWDGTNGEPLYTIEGKGHLQADFAIFDPSGDRLAISGGGDLAIYDISKLDDDVIEQIFIIDAHAGSVNEMAYSSDGSYLSTCSGDGTVKVWDAGSGTEWMTLPLDGACWLMAISPDGKQIASNLDDKIYTNIHIVPIDGLVALAKDRLTRGLTDEECRQFLHMETCPE